MGSSGCDADLLDCIPQVGKWYWGFLSHTYMRAYYVLANNFGSQIMATSRMMQYYSLRLFQGKVNRIEIYVSSWDSWFVSTGQQHSSSLSTMPSLVSRAAAILASVHHHILSVVAWFFLGPIKYTTSSVKMGAAWDVRVCVHTRGDLHGVRVRCWPVGPIAVGISFGADPISQSMADGLEVADS